MMHFWLSNGPFHFSFFTFNSSLLPSLHFSFFTLHSSLFTLHSKLFTYQNLEKTVKLTTQGRNKMTIAASLN